MNVTLMRGRESRRMEAVKIIEDLYDEKLFNLTEDDLPCDDGMPMETSKHYFQMTLLIDSLARAWENRQNFYVGGNMFVYFSPAQEKTHDFKGPDVFVVLDVPKHPLRKSWVVWQEGKAPDVVIELLSKSTAKEDKGKKKLVYQNQLRVPEYFWYDPFTSELAGFRLQGGVYRRIKPDSKDRLISRRLDLALVRWQGCYMDQETTWLRWTTPGGEILPTSQERERNAQQKADEAQQKADEAQQKVDEARQKANELENILTRYRRKFGDL